jgi:hypothetical protein
MNSHDRVNDPLQVGIGASDDAAEHVTCASYRVHLEDFWDER